MKHLQITLFILFLFNNIIIYNAQNTEGRITYRAAMITKSNYKKGQGEKGKKAQKSLTKLYKNAKDIEVYLEFNSKGSVYKAVEKMKSNNNKGFNFTFIMAGGKNHYYTYNSIMGYRSNTLDCYLLGECFLIENLLPKWELKQDSKIIQGFKCYKAILRNQFTGKQNIEVWYTPKIPYQYGVMNYFGLPGVILELNKNTFSIRAIKVELNPLKKIIIEEPRKAKKISRKEFKKLTKKVMPGFYKRQ